MWKEKDLSKIEDLTSIEKTFDWSFSTPYKGSVTALSTDIEQIAKEVDVSSLIDSSKLNKEDFKANLDFKSQEDIPLGMLGPENPILHYGEVVLFEDELGDKGYSKGNVRFRIMSDCFFILLRSYTRVDHVLVRIMDTRIFHKFGDDHLIRDFQLKENSYTQLKNKGFKFGSDWSLAPTQSDEIYAHLDTRLKTTDKIVLQ